MRATQFILKLNMKLIRFNCGQNGQDWVREANEQEGKRAVVDGRLM